MMKDDVKISSEALNDRARANYETLKNFFNVEEQAWQLAVLELALETLGVDPSKLLKDHPEEYCCDKNDHPEDFVSCWCCNGLCVWCHD
jgi:hypothetical protein